MPKEHFLSDEQPRLLVAPTDRYDTPIWCDPKVPRDHLASVARGLYSLPTEYIGQRLRARADSQTVRFYAPGGRIVKIHGRVGPGHKSIDAADFPRERSAYAMRDVDFLRSQAAEHDPLIGQYASRLLEARCRGRACGRCERCSRSCASTAPLRSRRPARGHLPTT
jgi:hypothetical protein